MKKMRRMIPALCMLLVSAIMLTTASYAWFTMNESVTASGMQVQAKASGNLLISDKKLTASDQGISLNLITQQANNAKKELSPITMVTTDGNNKAWKIAGVDVDATYGTVATLVDPTGALTFKASEYFSDYTFYLATAGEDLLNQYLYIDLVGLVGADQRIAPAYTIAFYVDADEDSNPDDNELVDVVNYEQYVKYNGSNIALGYIGDATDEDKADPDNYTKTFTIPSTYGKTADNPVGLRVMMRVYVDGALKADRLYSTEKTLIKVKDLVEDANEGVEGATTAKYLYNPTEMAAYKFYSVATEKDVYLGATATESEKKFIADETSEVAKGTFSAQTELDGEWYVWVGTDAATYSAYHDTTYVNNAWIPTDSTSFSVTVGVKDAPVAPEQGDQTQG